MKNDLTSKDLMDGDWVQMNNGPAIVIKERDILFKDKFGIGIAPNCKPIPLTPEILEKNGFVLESYSGGIMSGKWWTRNDFVIHESMNDSVGRNNFKYEYVHQLQHALRLCGITREIIL